MPRSSRVAILGLVGVLTLSGCGIFSAPPPPPVPVKAAVESRAVQVSSTFTTGGGLAITYDTDLVPSGAHAAVSAVDDAGGTTIKLALRGVEPKHHYGAHAHMQPCGPTGEAAGPHYQNHIDPVQPSVDPAYANPRNEIWLDVMTDATGAGSSETRVPWVFDHDRRANSVVIHAMRTTSEPGKAGTAGARAACISVKF